MSVEPFTCALSQPGQGISVSLTEKEIELGCTSTSSEDDIYKTVVRRPNIFQILRTIKVRTAEDRIETILIYRILG